MLLFGASVAASAASQAVSAPSSQKPIVTNRGVPVHVSRPILSAARSVNDRRADDRRIDNVTEERHESCAAVLSERTTDIDSRIIADIVADRRASCLAEQRSDNNFRQIVFLRRDDRRDDRQINQFRQVVFLQRDDRRDDRQLRQIHQVRQLRRDDRRDDRQLRQFQHARHDRGGGRRFLRVGTPVRQHHPNV